MTGIKEADKREQMEKGRRGGESDVWRRKAEERGVKVGSTRAFGRLNLSKV